MAETLKDRGAGTLTAADAGDRVVLALNENTELVMATAVICLKIIGSTGSVVHHDPFGPCLAGRDDTRIPDFTALKTSQ